MDLMNDLLSLSFDSLRGGKDWKRLRIALTPEEYEEVRKYMLKRYGEFFGRIRGIPFVVEETVERPVTMELP